MKKYFIVSDVHSFFDEMMRALMGSGFDINNPNHIFVSLGDLFDRGSQTGQCLQFVDSLPKERKILIRGNHEDLLESCIARREFLRHDISNGTMMSICDLGNYGIITHSLEEVFDTVKRNSMLKTYLKSLVDYYEDEKNIFVHGWIPCEHTNLYALIENWREDNWHDARWLNGMLAWKEGIRVPDKTIWCGHWHTSWGHTNIDGSGSEFGDDADFSPFVAPGIVAMDACTVKTHKVNCKVIEVDD